MTERKQKNIIRKKNFISDRNRNDESKKYLNKMRCDTKEQKA